MSRIPPLHVLIVEDESLIAMDIAMMLEDAGHQVTGEAASVDELLRLDPQRLVDLAFVDVHLARGSSGIDAIPFIQRCWPTALVVFVTANPGRLPADFAGAHGVVAKPFSTAGFESVIAYLEEGICDPPPTRPQPRALTITPLLSQVWHH